MAFVTAAAASLRPTATRAATSTAAVGRRDGAFVQPLRAAARVAAPRATVSMKSAEQQVAEVRAIRGAVWDVFFFFLRGVQSRRQRRLGGAAFSGLGAAVWGVGGTGWLVFVCSCKPVCFVS